MKVKHLIEAVIGILIGLALYPAVDAATDDAVANATGVALTLLPLIPTIYVIVVIAGAAAYVYSSN